VSTTVEGQIPELRAERFVTVAEAAKFLGVCRAKVYQIMDAGALKYAKFGASRRIPIQALREYADRCMIAM
jgi:excisionase family DNA binding protein